MDFRIKRTATAIAVATALAMPGLALAQTDAEKALEARVAELEKLVQQLSADQTKTATEVATTAKAVEEAKTPPAPPPAPTVSTANKGSLTVKGFVIASLYAQDANFAFGNGQSAEFPTGEYSTDKWTYGGDVRNTRLTLDWKGPEVANGAKFGGLVEMDGGLNAHTLPLCAAAGTDVFVAGSAIFGSEDYAETISRMKANAEG